MLPFKKWFFDLCQRLESLFDPYKDQAQSRLAILIIVLWLLTTLAIIYGVLHPTLSYANGSTLPGDDATDKLKAAGTLLQILDKGIFKWGARIFAGLCIMSSAWALKEQRFGIAVICVIGAIIFGTVTKWVANVFDIGGSDSVFGSTSLVQPISKNQSIAKLSSYKVIKHV